MSNIFRDTNPITTQGDIAVGDANGIPARLAIGTKGFAPQSTGTTLAYVPAQTDTNRITASYTVLDDDGYRTIIATTAPSTITFSSRSSNTITTTGAHGMLTGCPLIGNGGGTYPTGVHTNPTTTVYYAIVTGASTFQFATSIANALAGTAVALSGDGSGTRTWAPGIAVVLPTASANTDRRITVKKTYASSAPYVALVPEAAGETTDGRVGLTVRVLNESVTVVAENSLWYVESYGAGYETLDISGNNAVFDASQPLLKVSKIGSLVTLSFPQVSHNSSGSPATAASFIPSGYRSDAGVSNIYANSATEVFRAAIGTTGVLTFTYRDWAGSSSSRTNTGEGSISWVITE